MKQVLTNKFTLIGAALVLSVGAMYFSMTYTNQQRLVGMQTIQTDAFAAYVDEAKPTVLDVRTPEEYAAGHLEGARNIDFRAPSFRAELEKLDKSTPYAIYCRSGGRSGQALEVMRSMGFTSVVNLDGGMLAWQGEGRSVCEAGATC